MLVALAIYLAAASLLPADELTRSAGKPRVPLSGDERRGIWALAFLFIPVTLFWATYEQQGNTMVLWAADYTDRTVNLGVWRGEIPAEFFQSLNPFMIFAFTPIIVALWTWQGQRGHEPGTVIKMALGCFGVAAANLIMVAAAKFGGSAQVSSAWLLGYFVVVTLGELYLSPIGLSLVSKVAPVRAVSSIMGLWLATSFIGNFLAGWLGSFWSVMAKEDFFLMIATIAGAAGVAILIAARPLRRALDR
jgi:POT family proton-dependent oligopeptide transporter